MNITPEKYHSEIEPLLHSKGFTGWRSHPYAPPGIGKPHIIHTAPLRCVVGLVTRWHMFGTLTLRTSFIRLDETTAAIEWATCTRCNQSFAIDCEDIPPIAMDLMQTVAENFFTNKPLTLKEFIAHAIANY